MDVLAERIKRIKESATLQMSRRSKELQSEGVDIIDLSIGEPDFNTPGCIKDAAQKAIDDNHTHYTPVSGLMELRKVIVEKFRNDNNLEFKASQIVVSNGAKQSIANAMLCLVNPGDEVIIPTPYWVSYPEITCLAEGKPVFIHGGIENDFKVTPEQVENAITPRSKIFIFSSPCNPSGSVYTRDELEGLAAVFARYPQIYIISDEIYEYINYTGKHESIGQFASIADRVITVNGVSKGFAMTGWRIGYLAAPPAIAKACDTLQGQITSGACSISQHASINAIRNGHCSWKEVTTMVDAFRERRDLVISLLKTIPGFVTNAPAGAFYVFPDVKYFYGRRAGDKNITDDNDLAMYLLDKAHVAVVGGSSFGNAGCIRISYATSKEKLAEAIHRIRETVAALH